MNSTLGKSSVCTVLSQDTRAGQEETVGPDAKISSLDALCAPDSLLRCPSDQSDVCSSNFANLSTSDLCIRPEIILTGEQEAMFQSSLKTASLGNIVGLGS